MRKETTMIKNARLINPTVVNTAAAAPVLASKFFDAVVVDGLADDTKDVVVMTVGGI
jgi:hypothetical protein